MDEISGAYAALLIAVGIVAGIINTLAGGGSNLTLPALMVMGMPADVANATNRVGVLLQSITGSWDFHRHGRLPQEGLWSVLAYTLVGSLLGAGLAVMLPAALLKPLLLSSMVLMALVIVLCPNAVSPLPGTQPLQVGRSQRAKWLLIVAGIYGGFVQAGVGFILIAALAGGLRHSLVAANALKMFCTAGLTVLALLVFIWQDLVAWVPGLVLAVGTVLGAKLGVKIAIRTPQHSLKWFLFVMTLGASAAALWF